MSDGLLNALYIVPILAVLILVHEFGHFFAARAVGAKVEEFGIGIPPRAKGWEWKGVLWSLNWIPFGGFVRVLGEDGSNADPQSMNAKSPAQRALFLVAGSAMNVLLGLLLSIAVVAVQGVAVGATVSIGSVVPGSPAEQAGWLAGDRIVEVGGEPIESGNDVGRLTQEFAGRPMAVTLDRAGRAIETEVTPRSSPPAGEGPTGVVVSASPLYAPVPAVEVVPVAVGTTWSLLGQTIGGLRDLITGRMPLDAIAGPIGMGQITSEIVDQSQLPLWITLSQLAILLSLNLAILNLLPLPALDGGRLFFILIEVLRGGKRIPPEREGVVHLAGMVVLIGVMFLVAFLDVGRILSGDSILP